jgi:CBS domain-containing protein
MGKIKEIMSQKIKCCTPDSSLQEVAQMMKESDCGEIPVVENRENQKPVGVITDRDITIRSLGVGKNPMDLKARDCMTSKVISTSENSSVEDCLKLMEENQIRRLVVTDKEGRCCGLISQADIARSLGEAEAGKLIKEISRPSQESGRASLQ